LGVGAVIVSCALAFVIAVFVALLLNSRRRNAYIQPDDGTYQPPFVDDL